MKLAAQIMVYLAILFGCILSVAMGLLGKAGGLAPAGQEVWQQGLWPLHDRLVEEIKQRATVAGATVESPFRVALSADASAVPSWRFSAFSDEDLALALRTGVTKLGSVEIAKSLSGVSSDLSLKVVLESYTPGSKEDVLAGKTIFTSEAGKEDSTPFEIRCPSHGRSWFVQSAHLSGYVLAPLALLIVLSGIIGVWGARDAFVGTYAGSKRMGGAVFVLSSGAFLLLAYLCDPGFDRFGIPRHRIGVAVDSSDAIRYPPVPGAILPSPGHGETNDVCRFIGYCVSEIDHAMESSSGGGTSDDFLAWVQGLIRQIGRSQRQTQLLSASEGIDIEYNHPFAVDGVVTGAPDRTVAAEFHSILDAGHRGRSPGFFFPWQQGVETNENELVVAFMTGEPSSAKQARWLKSHRDSLRERRPPALRVVSVLLPAVARSSIEDWGSTARFMNVASISDVLITLGEPKDENAASGGDAVRVLALPVFDAMKTVDRTGSEDSPVADMDALRTRAFRAQDSAMRHAALQIAAEVRGLADVRETSVFQTRQDLLCLVVAMLSSLALFLGLQREIRALDNPSCVVGRLDRLGALCGLVFAVFVTLAIGYATSEPARWKTAANPLLVLWGVLALWYAGVWLPMLLGRGLGHLPRPVQALNLSWLLRWFCVAMFSQAVFLSLAGVKWLGSRGVVLHPMLSSPHFSVALKGMAWMAALATLALAISYGWICFWRPTRRRAFWSGYTGLIMIFALPLIGGAVPEASQAGGTPWPVIIGCVALVVAILLPTVLPFLPLRRDTYMERSWSMGWGTPILCLLGGGVISLLLFWPTPLAKPFGDGFAVNHVKEILIGATWLIAGLWLVIPVRRELRG